MHMFETTHTCPGQALGAGLGLWVNTLDHSDDRVLCAVLRMEGEMIPRETPRPPVRTVQLMLMRLRRETAAVLSPKQVMELDLLIDSPTWSLPELAHWQVHSGYFAERITGRVEVLLTAG